MVHVLDVLGGRVVIRHPDQVLRGNANLLQEISVGPALANLVPDLTSQLCQEPPLAHDPLWAAPRAEAGNDVLEPKELQPAQRGGPGRRVAPGQPVARAVDNQWPGEKHVATRKVNDRTGSAGGCIEWEKLNRQ